MMQKQFFRVFQLFVQEIKYSYQKNTWKNSQFIFEFEFEFIDKQPMKAGQGLKSSLATQKHRKKWHTYTQMKQ